MTQATLAELMIVAASECWRGDGEVLASGIGIVPRLGASLAKLTHTPELLMTDSEPSWCPSLFRWGRAVTTSRDTKAICPSTAYSNASGAGCVTR